jgi:hypothetical protein
MGHRRAPSLGLRLSFRQTLWSLQPPDGSAAAGAIADVTPIGHHTGRLLWPRDEPTPAEVI